LVGFLLSCFGDCHGTAKPLLGGLDQAFNNSKYMVLSIRCGVVFGMGILWKRATKRAALWTTIVTLPLDLNEGCLTELPFIIEWVRMYDPDCYCIILTLTDKNQVNANLCQKRTRKITPLRWVFALFLLFVWLLELLGTCLFDFNLLHLDSIHFHVSFLMGFLSIRCSLTQNQPQRPQSYDINLHFSNR
jgi:SSS family solute:Na+ symporter